LPSNRPIWFSCLEKSLRALLAGDGERAVRSLRFFGRNAPVFAYAASKIALSRWLRRAAVTPDWAGAGIRLNALAPGAILTPLLATNYGRGEKGYERAKEDLKTSQAVPRAGMPEDIARCALWLASDESTFVTAQAICVDGGFGAGREWAKQAQGFKVHKPMRIPGQARAKT
jgi:NAD(P)-dependent dehydrogenase (short-subunit alcohol dehydrogenase family)